MTNPNDKAFPNGYTDSNSLTKREYFAAMALQGLVSNSEHRKLFKGESYLMPSEIYTEQAVSLADALIKQLNESK